MVRGSQKEELGRGFKPQDTTARDASLATRGADAFLMDDWFRTAKGFCTQYI